MSATDDRPVAARQQVPSCHSDAGGRQAVAGSPVVALAGAPNVGKSTLFNTLCRTRRDVGNWPGTTVEVGRGAWRVADGDARDVELVDLPGAYSLDPVSPDEELTRALLLDVAPQERPDAVVVVASAVHLTRCLYLVAQLRETSQRVVVAVTMADVAARRGLTVDAHALATALGVPVVMLDPRRRAGAEALAHAVSDVLVAQPPAPRPVPSGLPMDDSGLALADDRFGWVAAAVAAGTVRDRPAGRTRSDRIDRWVTAPFVGPLVFLATMWLVFQTTTRIAAPFQNALDHFFSGPVAQAARAGLGAVGLGHGWVADFVVDGLIAGVGLLLTFVPLMTLMFVLLALLEDSGYMARAAVVTDRTMRRIGLPGRAFLPLVVGFGCNVPAISATRVLPNARHRVLTALLVPFTSCSARLTVYILVASIFFPHNVGNVVFVMYVVSILLVVLVGLALRRTLWRSVGEEPLLLDLPPYQRPTARITAVVTWVRLRGFLRTAGGIIVAAVSVVWLMQAIPVQGNGSFADVPVRDSLYAATAGTVAPVFDPAGFGNWHATGALMVGFVAKEAVISSWAQTYATQHPGDLHHPGALGTAVKADFARSSHGHPAAAAWAFLVFLLAYTPCVATLAAQRREIGMRWTWFGIGVQLLVAWTLAVAVFQIGRLLG
ncbi:MAG TPA: ferrous iron transport protein B [Actinomycetes bacterium]|nr:ferrous iron transport protein B [Actinomycetes bacterium]